MDDENLKSWWALVDEHWDLVRANVLPKFLVDSELVSADKAKIDRDAIRLHCLFEEAWWRAPDHEGIHSIPGWSEFCDLCSEF